MSTIKHSHLDENLKIPPYASLAGGLADRASSAIARENPPLANRGGSSRQASNETDNLIQKQVDRNSNGLRINPHTGSIIYSKPQTAPALRRGSRAQVTDIETSEFLKRHAKFDWLAVTIPNGEDGKGTKADGEAGDIEECEATGRLCTFAAANDMFELRTARGSDGFAGAMHLARNPVSAHRLMTIRTGHPINMPGIEITGGDGLGHVLATKALHMLGVVLLSRVDVAIDVSKAGLFDQLFEIAQDFADADAKGRTAPPRMIDAGTGRSFTFGGSNKKGAGKPEAEICVYEKGFEQLEKGKCLPADLDENWVRIEVRLRPRKNRKTGLARIARDNGPAALLGAVRWVREYIKNVVRLVGVSDNPQIAVTRISSRPDPAAAIEKSRAGIRQYARRFCEAAIVSIVDEKFDRDFLAAENITFDDVIERARRLIDSMFVEHISKHYVVQRLADKLEIDAVRCREERAERLNGRMLDWLDYQKREEVRSQSMLLRALNTASDRRLEHLTTIAA